MAMSCIARTASLLKPPTTKSTFSLVISSSMALVASVTFKNSLESALTSSISIFLSPTWTPPLALISSAAIRAPFQCPLPCTNCIGPITPILMVSAPQAGKQKAITTKDTSKKTINELNFFMTALLLFRFVTNPGAKFTIGIPVCSTKYKTRCISGPMQQPSLVLTGGMTVREINYRVENEPYSHSPMLQIMSRQKIKRTSNTEQHLKIYLTENTVLCMNI